MSATKQIELDVQGPWTGADPQWPREPRAGGAPEACWALGLPALRIDAGRPLGPKEPLLLVKGSAALEEHPGFKRLLDLPGVSAVTVSGSLLFVSAAGCDEGLRARVEEALQDVLSAGEESIRERVVEVLDAEINPSVALHGGFVELQRVEGTTLYLKMGGGCQGCGMAAVTLRQGVERTIRERVPEVTQILDATEHDKGQNPYYAAH